MEIWVWFSQPIDTDTGDVQTTSSFKVDKITVRDTGRWICQVKTQAGQAEKEFMIHVKGKSRQIHKESSSRAGVYSILVYSRPKHSLDFV